jgi:hypothetical protein
MTRADICASDDYDSIARLQAVIAELGGVADDNWHDSPIGTGLTRFRFGPEELTVFADAWSLDIAGPDRLVNDILAAFAGR